jgi:hypothetical protein
LIEDRFCQTKIIPIAFFFEEKVATICFSRITDTENYIRIAVAWHINFDNFSLTTTIDIIVTAIYSIQISIAYFKFIPYSSEAKFTIMLVDVFLNLIGRA